MKHNLTEEAKELAMKLVQVWDEGKIGQKSNLARIDKHTIAYEIDGNLPMFTFPFIVKDGILEELEKENLIIFDQMSNDLTLLQNLRDVVERDFEEPVDYDKSIFINGNLGSLNTNSTINNQQNVGVNYGVVTMTMQEIADELTNKLGEEFLGTQKELRDAIEELRLSNEADRQSKYGKVISQLGNSLGHVANFGTIMSTLEWLIKILPK